MTAATAASLATLALGLNAVPVALPGDESTQQFRRAARHLQAAGLALIGALRSVRLEAARRRADRAVLLAMDAHELRDLGIGRGEIESWTCTRRRAR